MTSIRNAAFALTLTLSVASYAAAASPVWESLPANLRRAFAALPSDTLSIMVGTIDAAEPGEGFDPIMPIGLRQALGGFGKKKLNQAAAGISTSHTIQAVRKMRRLFGRGVFPYEGAKIHLLKDPLPK